MSTAAGLESGGIEPPQPIPLHRRRLRLASPPTPLTRLIGRDAEVAAVVAMLGQREARLITLLGPGGIGKTRLALAIAAACADDFDRLVAWAPVATATTPEAVAAALFQAIGVAGTGAPPTIDALKSTLRDLRLLLVVDNFEQALDGAALLSDLLLACPDLSILVTSRALLRITGERAFNVPPLSTVAAPAGTNPTSVPAPAVELFAQQAASVYPAFALTPTTSPVVAAICQRLDGLPLAIELAAARSALLPPAALLDRLERRLPQLTGGLRDAPERHRTMRAAIAWSDDLLTPAEQAVFRCLSVFSGGCTLAAAEAVCQAPAIGDDREADSVMAVVESLIAQSLVRVDSTSTGDGEPRLTMLETVREFAAEQLAASGDDAPRRRHTAHFLDLATRVERGLWAGDYPRWSALIGPERANLRTALDWALHQEDANTSLHLAISMYSPAWVSDAYAQENEQYLKRALSLPGGTPAVRVAALVIAAWVAPAHFDNVEARALGEEALALAQHAGDDYGVASAVSALGVIQLHAGDDAGARAFLTEALDGFRRLRASTGVGWMLCDLAALDSRDAVDEGGDPDALDRARARYDEAVAIFRAIEHPRGIARSLHGLAYVTYKLRDLPRALANTQEVLTLSWEQRWPVFSYLEDIADIAGRLDQPEMAARLYGAADKQRERFGLPLEPQYRAEYERDAAVARRALGEMAFTAAWDAGRTLEPEQAVAEALAVAMPSIAHAPSAAVSLPIPLSPREIEVLRMLSQGLSDREIADALFIGERTVNTHVSRLYTKLGVRNRAAAVSAAAAAGFFDPSSTLRNPR